MKRPEGDWASMLAARPHRNRALVVTRHGATGASIEAPVDMASRRGGLWRWIVPVAPVRRVALDGLGLEVFDLCDGARSVEEIVDEFARRHRLTFHESRSAVTEYMKTLVRRGVLAVEMREESEGHRCQ